MVAGFNRVLMVRLSLKRYKKVSNASNRFDAEYPFVLAGNGQIIDPTIENDHEEKNDFTGAVNKNKVYKYERSGGYFSAGAFIEMIDPLESMDENLDRIKALYDDGFFDINTGSLVIDMMVYNGNEDTRFVQIGLIFSFNFAGVARGDFTGQPFNLDLLNVDHRLVTVRICLESIILMYILWFWKVEVMKMYEQGPRVYLTTMTSLIEFTSLLLCTAVILIQVLMYTNPKYRNFTFDLIPDPFNANQSKRVFSDLEELGMQAKFANRIIAISILVVFCRATMLLSNLSPSYSLVFNTLASAASNLIFFLLMFSIMFAGFAVFGFFSFGTGYEPMHSIPRSILEAFSMLLGKTNYEELKQADSAIAVFFYPVFHTFFFFIIINMFISILLTAYDLETFRLEKQQLPDSPFLQVFNLFRSYLRALSKSLPSFIREAPEVSLQKAKEIQMRISRLSGMQKGDEDRPVSAIVEVKLEETFKMSEFKDYRIVIGEDGCVRNSDFKKIRVGDVFMSVDDGVGMKPFSLVHYVECFENVEFCEATVLVQHVPSEKKFRKQRIFFQFFTSIIYLLIFLLAVSLQVRSRESNSLAQASQRSVEDATWWSTDEPRRMMEFEKIRTVQDIYGWANITLREFYDDCPARGPCVPRIKHWNRGFLNTTFLRLTMQHACFTENAFSDWKKGYPIVRSADDTLTLDSGTCKDFFDDTAVSARSAITGKSGETYRFVPPGKLGPYGADGGFVIKFGLHETDALAVLNNLYTDEWFSQNTVELVFDWITYNGNIDMFTYNEVQFTLLKTGKLEYNFKAQTFPLELGGEGGGYFSQERVYINILSILYGFAVFFITIKLVYDIRNRKKKIQKAKRLKGEDDTVNLLDTLKKYYSSTIWNVSDSISLLLSFLTIVTWLMFVLSPFRQDFRFSNNPAEPYQIPNSDQKYYNFKGNDKKIQEDWYIFMQLGDLKILYGTFFAIASINCFFVSIKVGKYLSYVTEVHILTETLWKVMPLIMNVTAIILFLMFGFCIMFHVEFGVLMGTHFGSPGASFLTLFRFMLGEFDQLPEMLNSSVLAAPYFMVYMLFFYLIFINYYLATMMSTYATTVSGNEYKKAVRDIRLAQEKNMRTSLMSKESQKNKLKELQRKKLRRGEGISAADFTVEAEVAKPTLNFWRYHGAVTFLQRKCGSEINSARRSDTGRIKETTDDEDSSDSGRNDAPLMGDASDEMVEAKLRRARLDYTTDSIKKIMFKRLEGDLMRDDDDFPMVTLRDNTLMDLADWMEKKFILYGEEVWLDLLVTALEDEGLGDSLTNLLRTPNMIDPGGTGPKADKDRASVCQNFYRMANSLFLDLLYKKAFLQYYQYLEKESVDKQKTLKMQNAILNTYAIELNSLFEQVKRETDDLQNQLEDMKKALIKKKD